MTAISPNYPLCPLKASSFYLEGITGDAKFPSFISLFFIGNALPWPEEIQKFIT